VFYEDDGLLQVAQIPWEEEASFRLPASVWKAFIEEHHPNSVWVCLRRDVFDRLRDYRDQKGVPTWKQTIEALLAASAVGCANKELAAL
jgi:hypothetical protein